MIFLKKTVAICYKVIYNIRVRKTLLDAILLSYSDAAGLSGKNCTVSPKKTIKIFAAFRFDSILGSVILFCTGEN